MSTPRGALGEALARVLAGHVLSGTEMESAMDAILGGDAPSAQIAGLAIALRMRGETAGELAAAARAMRRRAAFPPARSLGAGRAELAEGRAELAAGRAELEQGEAVVFDSCGTGGDGAGTFNVSTACAIVVAACGVRVAKHGNRAVSSRAGSADVLAALGITIDPPAEEVARHLEELGIGFFFAPAFHAALKHAAIVRRELGVRTFFNLLGPLANPAGATHQLVGVYERERVRVLAEVLAMLGVRGAWVVHGHGGLDEISPEGETHVARLVDGHIDELTIAPTDFGIASARNADIAGGDAHENARMMRALLGGEPGARRTAVVINAAAALVIARAEGDLRAARERAEAAIDSGAAARLLDAWIAASAR